MHGDSTGSSFSARFVKCALALSVALFLSFTHPAAVLAGPVFTATLEGTQEVPPNASTATGEAVFTFNDDLTELSYELSVFGLFNITMAHIHLAPAGVNGPVVLWLYPDGPPAQQIPGETNGLFASRTVTWEDLVGSLLNEPLSALYAEMLAGNTYVNIHTVAYPAGEIRGQISLVPEPATLPMAATGLLMLLMLRRSRHG